MKKRLLSCLLVLVLTVSVAMAEEISTLDGSDVSITPLSMTDYTAPGFVPNESNYTESVYQDASLLVEMERVWVEDSCYHVAHVKIAHPSQLRTALAGKLGKKTNYVWNIAKNVNAVVAIGGEDLAENNKTYTVRMGETLRKKGYAGRDTLVIDQHGDFHILNGYSDSAREALEAEGIQPVNLFNFGPALVVDGQVQEIPGKYSVGNPNGTEPRCAIGQMGPLEYLLVVVDGRNVKSPVGDGTTKASAGATCAALAAFMQEKGCLQAYNLDGGGSAVMTFNGGNKYSTPSSERGVSDIVYFASAVEGN